MKNANPKVSVIMPSLNVGKYIREALTSVCNQTLKDIEIICVDAGSTDGTLEIIEEFADRDARIKIVHSDRKSYGRQLNLGILSASGIYMGIVETDDYVVPEMYEKLSLKAEETGAEIVQANYCRFTGEGTERKFVTMPCVCNGDMYNKVIKPSADTRAFSFSIICGCLYSLDFIRSHGIVFNETAGASYQDIGFFYQTRTFANRLVSIKEPLYMYRQDNPGSSINSKSKVFACCEEYSWLRSQLRASISDYTAVKKNLGRGMYYGYMSALSRIADEYREGFVERFSQDLLEAEALGELSSEMFPASDWKKINQIMRHPKAFLQGQFSLDQVQLDVTVIIPVYNDDEYLSVCLDSVLAQNVPSMEVICVDDGSTDDSLKILNAYAERDHRVVVISQKNSGASVARNKALSVAKGEFVAFMDSDDLYPSENVLSKLISVARKERVEVVGGQLERFSPDDPRKITRHKAFPFLNNGLNVFARAPFDFFYTLFVFSRKLIVDNGVQFPEVSRYQDPPFMVRVMNAAKIFYLVDFPTYRYRFGHQNINWTKDDYRKARDMLKSMADVVEFAADNGLDAIIKTTKKRLLCDYAKVLFSQIPDVRDFPEFKRLMAVFPPDIAEEINQRIPELIIASMQKTMDLFDDLKLMEQKLGVLDFVKTLARNFFYRRDKLIALLNDKRYIPQIRRKNIRTIGIMYYNLNVGGVQRVITSLAPVFQKLGYEVVLIVEQTPVGDCLQIPENVKIKYVLKSHLVSPKNVGVRIQQLSDIIKLEKIDVLYYHSYTSHLFIWDLLTAKLVGNIPVIMHFHGCVGTTLYTVSSVPDFSFLHARARMCDKVITLSRIDELFFKTQGVRAEYIVNPVDPCLMEVEIAPSGDRFAKKKIVWCARMSPEKNPIDVLEILKEVQCSIPDAKLVMVGGGDSRLENEVRLFAKRNSLSGSVEFIGNSSNPYQYYSEGSLFLMTSSFEGFALTLLEAGMHGMPTVMYSMPFLETVRDNGGIVQVTRGDIKAAAAAIVELMSDEGKYLKTAAANQEFMRKLASVDQHKRWKSVIDELTDDKMRDEIVPPVVDSREVAVLLDELAWCYAAGFWTLKAVNNATGSFVSSRTISNIGGEKIVSMLNKEVNELKNSESYRVGLFVTYPFRRVWRGVKCFRENGFYYTFRHGVDKIKKRICRSGNSRKGC